MTLDPSFGDRVRQRRAARQADGAAFVAPETAELSTDAPCVLIVDDEPEITRSIAELLAPDYQVLTAHSANEALTLLEANSVAVILTDQRMPGGTGAELLARSFDISPETTRILFTGYSDISAVIDAVNEGQVYRYITKPWRPEELRAILRKGLERYRLVVENRRLLAELTQANRRLVVANRELREFAYAIAHDVRAPLRAIDGFSAMVVRDAGPTLAPSNVERLHRVREAAQRMGVLIDDLLGLSWISSREMLVEEIDLSAMAASVVADLRHSQPARHVEVAVAPDLRAWADRVLLRVILANLLGNAWKFTSKHESAHIEVGVADIGGERAYLVRDDGAGFDPQDATHLFGAFQRMHPAAEWEGEGIGLATVQRLVARHGGRVWAEAAVEKGATFYFTLPTRH